MLTTSSTAVAAVTAASTVLVAPILFGLFRLASARAITNTNFALIASAPFLVYFPAAILGGHTHEVAQTLEDGWTLREFARNVSTMPADGSSSSSSSSSPSSSSPAADRICQNLLSQYEELEKNQQEKDHHHHHAAAADDDDDAMPAEFGLRARFAKDSLKPVVVHCLDRLEQSSKS